MLPNSSGGKEATTAPLTSCKIAQASTFAGDVWFGYQPFIPSRQHSLLTTQRWTQVQALCLLFCWLGWWPFISIIPLMTKEDTLGRQRPKLKSGAIFQNSSKLSTQLEMDKHVKACWSLLIGGALQDTTIMFGNFSQLFAGHYHANSKSTVQLATSTSSSWPASSCTESSETKTNARKSMVSITKSTAKLFLIGLCQEYSENKLNKSL